MAAADPFYGVTRGSHIGALERLYKVINPDKVHQVTLMLDKFGLGIWASLKSKYPEVDIDSYTPKPLVEASFGGAADDVHIAALTRFYSATAPEKLGQVPAAWAKFRHGIWAALALKYDSIDVNSFAPIASRASKAFTASVSPTSAGNPFGKPAVVPPPVIPAPAVTAVAPTPAVTNPFIRHGATAPAPVMAPAPAPAPVVAPAPAAAPSRANPFGAPPRMSTPELPRSGSFKVTASDLEPSSFSGVPDTMHLEGLRNFYAAVNPEKMAQVTLVWQKFGPGVWKALFEKYPDVDFGKFAPVRSRQTFASSNVFALSGADSPRRASGENIFGMESPTKLTVSSPLSRAPSDSALLPPAPSPAPAVSVSALFGDDAAHQQAPKPIATASAASLFQPELLAAGATQSTRPSREAMFQSGGPAEEATPSDGQGSFAQALLEEDGGIQDAAPSSSLGGLFAADAPAGPAAPSFGEISSFLESTSMIATHDYNSLFTAEVAAPSQEAAPVDAAPKASRAQTALFASPADSDGDGLFSTLSLDSDAPASADLFGMVTTTGKPKANTPAGGGIGDIASYVKASQASGSGALFQ